MSNSTIIDEMFVLVAEIQGDIYSMEMNPTYKEHTVGIQILEVISDALYSELTSYSGIKATLEFDGWVTATSNNIKMFESLITEIDEFYFLYTYISQLNTKINQIK